MAVKLGYEEIESEAAPIGWSHDCLGNICTISSGTTPLRSAAERYYRNGTIHWVKTTDLTNSDISATEELVTKTALDETSLKVYPVGIVLVAMYGGFNQIGRTGLLKIPAAVNQAITAIQPNPKSLVSEYLINVLNFRVNDWKTVASSSRKDPNITSNDIKKFPIIFPSIGEQQAIATALSDVDALIASLDQLIAKKRDIKQATMQQLLTGKTRLPGFSKGLKFGYKQTEVGEMPEDWCVKNLGEIGECLIGLTYQPRDVQSDGLLVLRSSNIGDSGMIFDDNVFVNVEVSNKLILRKDDILICVRNGSRNLIGKCALIDDKTKGMTFGAFMSIFRTQYAHFVFYQFQSKQIKSQIHENIGATINQITNKNLNSFQIPFPTFPEQHAIATVLSDMDAEIAALEQKRDKTRALKQGMMQELLTGKTRLL